MIATIKAELRKTVHRPAFRVVAVLLPLIVVGVYGADYYSALHPTGRGPSSLPILYPHEFVNFIIGAAFPLGAAMAIVLGALAMGSEFSWTTFKTLLTQRPGRLAGLTGRYLTFLACMLVFALVLFVMAAACSVVIALLEGHVIEWPGMADIVKGLGAVWLTLALYGGFGMLLGLVFRQAAVALGAGLIYVAMVQSILIRFLESIDNGQYKWITDWFDEQNVQSLLQTFTSPAFGHAAVPAVSSTHAILVIVTYLTAFIAITALIFKRRDVA